MNTREGGGYMYSPSYRQSDSDFSMRHPRDVPRHGTFLRARDIAFPSRRCYPRPAALVPTHDDDRTISSTAMIDGERASREDDLSRL